MLDLFAAFSARAEAARRGKASSPGLGWVSARLFSLRQAFCVCVCVSIRCCAALQSLVCSLRAGVTADELSSLGGSEWVVRMIADAQSLGSIDRVAERAHHPSAQSDHRLESVGVRVHDHARRLG